MAHRSFKVGLHKLVGDYMVAMSIFYIVYVSTSKNTFLADLK